MEEPEVKLKPSEWPREWWHDEKFWKDVASRTVAGAIVVFLGYLAALAGGYIAQPQIYLPLAMGVIGFLFILNALRVSVKNFKFKEEWRGVLIVGGTFAFIFVILTAAFLPRILPDLFP